MAQVDKQKIIKTIVGDVFTNELEPFITNSVKTNPDLQVYRDNKVTMAYYYQDMDSEFLTKIVVTPDEYEP